LNPEIVMLNKLRNKPRGEWSFELGSRFAFFGKMLSFGIFDTLENCPSHCLDILTKR